MTPHTQKEQCSEGVGKIEQRGTFVRLWEMCFEERWLCYLECMLNNPCTPLLTYLHTSCTVLHSVLIT